MDDAAATASRFTGGLLDPAVATPAGLGAHSGGKTDKRYAVYRNNVTASLVSAISEIYPGLMARMGDEAFSAMARGYVRRHPPRSPLLFDYGRNLADFLKAAPQMGPTPELVDLARLERHWLDAFHAADAAIADPGALAAIEPDDVGNARFKPHPAARIMTSRFALFDLFAKARGLAAAEPAAINEPQAVLVTRPDIEVTVTCLDLAGAAFIEGLMNGDTLGEAAQIAANTDTHFDLGAALGLALSTGAFCAVPPSTSPIEAPEHAS